MSSLRSALLATCGWIAIGASTAIAGAPLAALAPPSLPDTVAVETFPPVLGITNAERVFALDYRDPDRQATRAGFFIAETSGAEPYDHNRKTCRLVAEGARLEDVFRTTVGAGFFHLVATTKAGQIEYSLQFVVRETADHRWLVDSLYLEEQYGAEPDAIRTLSVQFWGYDLFDVRQLAGDFLDRLAALGAVVFRNTSAPSLPRVTIDRASHFNGRLRLWVTNRSADSEEVGFELFHTARPGSPALRSSVRRTIKPGASRVAFSTEPMSSILAYAVDSTLFRDQAFVGRGFGYFTDASAGGRSSARYDDRVCDPRELQSPPGGFLLLPGCAKIDGRVDRWVGVFLPVGSFVGEVANLKRLGFTRVRFLARSTTAFRMQVEDLRIRDFDFHGVNLAASAEWRQYVVPLDTLTQRGFGQSKPFTRRVLNLSWLVDPPDGSLASYALEVAAVSLLP
jgi:hypothetical protein